MTDNTQPEALRLAEILEGDYCPDWFYEQGVDEVAAELRRQHTRIAELQSELEAVGAGGVQALSAAPAIKPLVWSDESGPTDKIRYNHITAETALGQFSVEWKGWKEEDGPCVYLAGDYIGVASNLGGAKQLAERHIRELVANLLAAPAEQQAAPKAAPEVGNSGFDHKTAADFLNGKTVSDEAVRNFVAASRWAHDERAALSATLLAMHGVLTSREAEIALLKKALLEAEAPPQQEVQEPSHRETVDVVGVRSNGEHVNLEKIAMPPRMKAREIAIEQFGSFKDDDGSDAEMCFGALEYFLEWLIQQGWSKAPQPAPAPLSEREAFERGWGKRHAPVTINGRTRDDGRYGDSSIQDAWESWQARAALAAQGGKDA